MGKKKTRRNTKKCTRGKIPGRLSGQPRITFIKQAFTDVTIKRLH